MGTDGAEKERVRKQERDEGRVKQGWQYGLQRKRGRKPAEPYCKSEQEHHSYYFVMLFLYCGLT